MKRQIKISASIMCADLFNLRDDIILLDKAKIDLLHVDIMYGFFVPNITLGFDLANQLSNISTLPKEVHLMMSKPDVFLDRIVVFPSDTIIFHIETCNRPNNLINLIRKKNCRIGVALNPLTPVKSIKKILSKIDLLLIMTVTPGFPGQAFIDLMVDKVREASHLGLKINQNMDIEVDGGLTKQRIKQLYKIGANVFVAGTSTIFKDRNLEKNIQDLRSFTAKLETGPVVIEKN